MPQSTAAVAKLNSPRVPQRTDTYAYNVRLKKRATFKRSHAPNTAKIAFKTSRFAMTTICSVRLIMKEFIQLSSVIVSLSEDNYSPKTSISSLSNSLVLTASFAGSPSLQKTRRSRLLGVHTSIRRRPSIITEGCRHPTKREALPT